MNYRDQLIEHLCIYKETVLGITVPGIYRHRGRDISCRHILPRTERWQNILAPIRPDVQAYLRTRPEIKLHRYFHHLNSSQAFALNLFFPYFDAGPDNAGILLAALGQEGTVKEDDWKIEDVPDKDEKSNIDVTWTSTLGTRTLCEVKLTESGFGKAKDDRHHLEKLRRLYEPRLHDRVDPELLRPKHFFHNYQILRNIWHLAAAEASRLIFLLPQANADSWRAVTEILPRLREDMRAATSIVSVERLITQLCSDPTSPTLQQYARSLAAKYIIASSFT
jgi:restriction endonuclease-like protein